MGSKITADGDYSHEIKRCLFLGRKVMINLDSILKSRDITLTTKFPLVKTMVFRVVMYGCDYPYYYPSSSEQERILSEAFLRVSTTLVQFSSVTQLCLTFATPCTATRQASLSITNSRSSLNFMFIESVIPSNNFILCRPLLLPHSIFPSIRVFSNESVLHIRWPKYWSFSFSISPSDEYLGLITVRMDWLDLLAVQGTLKSLLQHHSSKASILWHSSI